jgi:hypothetical protein
MQSSEEKRMLEDKKQALEIDEERKMGNSKTFLQ